MSGSLPALGKSFLFRFLCAEAQGAFQRASKALSNSHLPAPCCARLAPRPLLGPWLCCLLRSALGLANAFLCSPPRSQLANPASGSPALKSPFQEKSFHVLPFDTRHSSSPIPLYPSSSPSCELQQADYKGFIAKVFSLPSV